MLPLAFLLLFLLSFLLSPQGDKNFLWGPHHRCNQSVKSVTRPFTCVKCATVEMPSPSSSQLLDCFTFLFVRFSFSSFVHMMKSERCFLQPVESAVFALRAFYTCWRLLRFAIGAPGAIIQYATRRCRCIYDITLVQPGFITFFSSCEVAVGILLLLSWYDSIAWKMQSVLKGNGARF